MKLNNSENEQYDKRAADPIGLKPFKIESEEVKYTCILTINTEEFFISITDNNNISYSLMTSIKDLKEKHEVFNFFEKSEQYYNFFQEARDNKKIKIKKELENIKLTIFFNFLDDNEESIDFTLPSRLNVEGAIKQILNDNKKLKEENKKIKNELEKIKERLTCLEKAKEIERKRHREKEDKKKEDEKMEEKKESLIEEEKKQDKSTFDSGILKNIEDKDFLKNAVQEELNKDIKEIIRLYSSKNANDSDESFIEKCINKNNNLCILEAENGKIFGGFTTKIWEYKSENKKDQNAFLFSLNNEDKDIYHVIKGKDAIYNNKKGIAFGYNGNDFYLYEGRNGLRARCTKECSFNYKGKEKALAGTYDEIKNFNFEIFQILFN